MHYISVSHTAFIHSSRDGWAAYSQLILESCKMFSCFETPSEVGNNSTIAKDEMRRKVKPKIRLVPSRTSKVNLTR